MNLKFDATQVWDAATCAAVSADARYIVLGHWFGELTLHQVPSGDTLCYLPSRPRWPVIGYDLGTSNVYVVYAEEGRYSRWNYISGVMSEELPRWSNQEVFALGGGRVVTYNKRSNETARVARQAATGREMYELVDYTDSFFEAVFSPDNASLLLAGETLQLWNIAESRPVRTFAGYVPKKGGRHATPRFSPDGRYALSGNIRIWNVLTGDRFLEYEALTYHKIDFSYLNVDQDDTLENVIPYLLLSPDGSYALSGDATLLDQWYTETGTNMVKLRDWKPSYQPLVISPDARHVAYKESRDVIALLDITNRAERQQLLGHSALIGSLAFLPDGQRLLSTSLDGTVRIWDVATAKEIVKMIYYTDGEWITITPEGYYNCSPKGDKYLNVRIGNRVYGVDNFREKYYRPDLVRKALAGESLLGLACITNVHESPLVVLDSVAETVTGDVLMVNVHISDVGGGVGRIRIRANGTTVIDDDAAKVGVVVSNTNGVVTRAINVGLINGMNTISVSAFNNDNSMESLPAVCEVTAHIALDSRPALYAVVVGVDHYANTNLDLVNCASDADMFSATLKAMSTGLFSCVEVMVLTNKTNTSKRAILDCITAHRTAKPNSVFVFYTAAHGRVIDARHCLYTSDVVSREVQDVLAGGINHEELRAALSRIPSVKKVIVLDMCYAGAMGAEVVGSMPMRAPSDRSPDDQKSALWVLNSAVGSTILAACGRSEGANEGYQDHGVFTYAVSEGWRGQADLNTNGYVYVSELGPYSERRTSEIVEMLGRNAKVAQQKPISFLGGEDFPVAAVQQAGVEPIEAPKPL